MQEKMYWCYYLIKLLFKKVVQHDTRPLAYACEDAITLPQIESKSVGNSDISKDRL